MKTRLFPRIAALTGWPEAHDERAARHLSLLNEAARILTGDQTATVEGRRVLAARLERCRYQLLNRRRGVLAPDERRLADSLDLAANDLAGRPARPARSPREAIEGSGFDLSEIEAVLDPGVALADVCRTAADLTAKHFDALPSNGSAAPRRRMLLYAPLYLSSHCINACLYCGFRSAEAIEREHLSEAAATGQAEILMGRGFRHLLLVAGDFPKLTTIDYFAGIIRALRAAGCSAAVEIAAQSTDAYAALAQAGACGVTLYQETFDETLYRRYHPRGSKVSYDWRLEALERAAEAGIRRLGLGVLLGLCDPRQDLLALVRHGRYLEARFPGCRLAFGLPRIHEAPAGFQPPFPVDDETFIRLYCALRVAFPWAELVLSTREPAALRNRLAKICITQMSAASSTAPGGYGTDAADQSHREQFPVADHRSVPEVAQWLREAGFELAWDIGPKSPSP
ncbi:MAG: radical SAM protein [Pirellulales bacterium]